MKVTVVNMMWLTYFLFSFAVCVHSHLLSIPLKRMQSPRQAMAEVDTEVDQVLAHDRMFHRKKVKAVTNDSVALFKYWDSEFYGEISLGHPAQTFTVVFDTAWSNTWVPSSKCSYLSFSCWRHNRYNSKASSTYIENGTPFTVDFGNSSVMEGFLSSDTFLIGHISMKNITFAEIVDVPGMYFFSKADGVVGMAYSTFAVDGVVPIFYSLIKRGLIKKPIFSFYFNRDHTTKRAGNLILGGSDGKHYKGNFTYLTVKEKAYWKIQMDRVEINDTEHNKTIPFCIHGCDAVLDSSTITIAGPPAEVARINKILDATDLFFGRWKVPCNLLKKFPEMNFVFAGKYFLLKPLDYIQQMPFYGFTICLSSFTSTDDPKSNVWFVGAAFMSRYYTEFDLGRNRVGFAEVK